MRVIFSKRHHDVNATLVAFSHGILVLESGTLLLFS